MVSKLESGLIAVMAYFGISYMLYYLKLNEYIHDKGVYLLTSIIISIVIFGLIVVALKNEEYNLTNITALGTAYFVVPFLVERLLEKFGIGLLNLVQYALYVNLATLPALFTFLLGTIPGLVTTSILTIVYVLIGTVVVIELVAIGWLINKLVSIMGYGG